MEAQYSTLSVQMEVAVSGGSCVSQSNMPVFQATASREEAILFAFVLASSGLP